MLARRRGISGVRATAATVTAQMVNLLGGGRGGRVGGRVVGRALRGVAHRGRSGNGGRAGGLPVLRRSRGRVALGCCDGAAIPKTCRIRVGADCFVSCPGTCSTGWSTAPLSSAWAGVWEWRSAWEPESRPSRQRTSLVTSWSSPPPGSAFGNRRSSACSRRFWVWKRASSSPRCSGSWITAAELAGATVGAFVLRRPVISARTPHRIGGQRADPGSGPHEHPAARPRGRSHLQRARQPPACRAHDPGAGEPLPHPRGGRQLPGRDR